MKHIIKSKAVISQEQMTSDFGAIGINQEISINKRYDSQEQDNDKNALEVNCKITITPQQSQLSKKSNNSHKLITVTNFILTFVIGWLDPKLGLAIFLIRLLLTLWEWKNQ